jgi:hypothetical protein
MKKTVKRLKKPNSQRKKTKKRKDALRAIQLVAVLVVLSAVISFALIKVHSHLIKPQETVVAEDDLPLPVNVEADPIPETIQPVTPSVSVQETESIVVETPPAVTPARPSVAAPVSGTAIPAAIHRPLENLGTLVFVIDDAGNNLRELEPFLRIPGPLTIAVLPGLPYSAEAARRIRAAGKEVI